MSASAVGRFSTYIFIILFASSIVVIGARELKIRPVFHSKTKVDMNRLVNDLQGNWDIAAIAEQRRKRVNDQKIKEEKKQGWQQTKDFIKKIIP